MTGLWRERAALNRLPDLHRAMHRTGYDGDILQVVAAGIDRIIVLVLPYRFRSVKRSPFLYAGFTRRLGLRYYRA